MEPTYHSFSLVLIDKRGSLPARGEVIIFRAQGLKSKLVKRVAGVPGDTLVIRDGNLLVNGTVGTVDTEYIEVPWHTPFGTLPEANREGGYVFDGWITDAGTPVTPETMNDEAYELTLFARWLYWMEAGLIDYMLPSGTIAIEEGAFEGVPAVVVYIPDGGVSIDAYAFRNCADLRQIRIPVGCSIDEDAFAGCSDILIFGASGSSAQEYCNNHSNCTFVEE